MDEEQKRVREGVIAFLEGHKRARRPSEIAGAVEVTRRRLAPILEAMVGEKLLRRVEERAVSAYALTICSTCGEHPVQTRLGVCWSCRKSPPGAGEEIALQPEPVMEEWLWRARRVRGRSWKRDRNSPVCWRHLERMPQRICLNRQEVGRMMCTEEGWFEILQPAHLAGARFASSGEAARVVLEDAGYSVRVCAHVLK